MKRTLDDLRGALHDEADASAYPDVDALVAGAWQRVAATRRRRLAVLGAVTVALLVVGGMATTRLTHQTLPQPAGKGTCGPTANPTPSLPASQSTADALVYGIEAVVAALPIGVRVQQLDTAFWPVATSQAPTPEGLWLVSRADVGAHPELAEYGELLLLTPDRTRILSAYPFRGVPPQWLLVTPQAVYCGRQGDGGLPDSMVCRVDRPTGGLTVAVFPSPTDSSFSEPQALAGRPGTWRLYGTNPSTADLQQIPTTRPTTSYPSPAKCLSRWVI